MRIVPFIGLCLFAGIQVSAQEPHEPESFAWQMNGKSAPADPSMASKNGFGVQMILTPDIEGFWKAWEGPTPPNLIVTDSTERLKPVHAMLVFAGCKAAADGNCNLSAIFTVTSPDGSAYGEPHPGKVWSGPPAGGYNLQLSEGSLGLIIEADEPLGRYLLKASVTDHVAGITLAVEAPVEAEELQPSQSR